MSQAVEHYRWLTQTMQKLDDLGAEESADEVRDALDHVWFNRLSEAERDLLNPSATETDTRNHP